MWGNLTPAGEELFASCIAPDLLPSVLSFPGKRKQCIFTLIMQITNMQLAHTVFPVLHSLTAFLSFLMLSWVFCQSTQFFLEHLETITLNMQQTSSSFWLHAAPPCFLNLESLCFWFKRLHWTFSWPNISHSTLLALVLFLWEGWARHHGNQQSQMGSARVH